MKRIVLACLLVVACSKKKEEPKPPPPSPSPASGSAPAAAPTPDAATAPKVELLPAKLGEKEAIVFAEKPGEQVTSTRKGQSVMIPDGTKVELVKVSDVGVGSEEEAHDTVKFDRKDVELKADRVITEEALKRSPDGKHAVFLAITNCGDLCHSVMYLISADGRRTKLGEGGPDLTVAWTADKVAVGNHGLWIANLADHTVKSLDGYTAPAYAPDGTLYVRDPAGSAFKVEGDKPALVWKAKKKKQADDEDMPDEDPEPVTFEGGKPKFAL